MGRDARREKTPQELIDREIEYRQPSRPLRWLLAHPRVTYWIITFSWPIYAVNGKFTDWRTDRDILRAL